MTEFNFEIYRNPKNKQFYWREKAKNGRIRGDSGEGYHRKAACMRFPLKFKAALKDPNSVTIKDLTK